MFTSTLRGRRLVIPISLTLKRLHQQQPRPAEPPACAEPAERPERPVVGLFCKPAEAPRLSRFAMEETEAPRSAACSSPSLVSVTLQAEVQRARIRHAAAAIPINPVHSPATRTLLSPVRGKGPARRGRSPLLALGDVGFSTSTAPAGSGPSPEAVLARQRAVPARGPSAQAASGPREASPLCLKTGFRSLRLGSHRGPLHKAPKPALQLLICEIGPGKLGGYTDAAGRQAIQRNAQKSRETRRHLLS